MLPWTANTMLHVADQYELDAADCMVAELLEIHQQHSYNWYHQSWNLLPM